MTIDATFGTHIDQAIKCRKQMGWILRTFTCRDALPMLTLYRTLLLPLMNILLSAVAFLSVNGKYWKVCKELLFARYPLWDYYYWDRLKKLHLGNIHSRGDERYNLHLKNSKWAWTRCECHRHHNQRPPTAGYLCVPPRVNARSPSRQANNYLAPQSVGGWTKRLYNSLPRYCIT